MPDDDILVLDTHVWIWIVEGQKSELSRNAVRRVEAASRRGGVWVSVISVWEVAMLEARGRLSLSRPVDEWVQAALKAPGTRLLDLSPEIAIESTRLPGTPHGDPADRILMASARVAACKLATRDESILDYASGGHLDALDARP